MRKSTVFELCSVHKNLALEGRHRLAEVFCEGGPGYGSPCSPQLCHVRPGTDLFAATTTDDIAAQWVRDWAVNQ